MSIPADKAATQGSYQGKAKAASEDKSFGAVVNNVVENLKRDEAGKYVFPTNISEEVKFAALAEQRRRDTQAELTKIAQNKKRIEAENSALKKKILKDIAISLTPEQAEELEDIKFSDPDTWRKKVNVYEQEAKDKYSKELEEDIAKVSADNLAESELENRKSVLIEFNKANPDFKLDDDVLKNDIPPRITKRLETGQISFADFLKEVNNYMKTGKVIKQEAVLGDPNLSNVGGGNKPEARAVQKDIIMSYKKEIY